MAHTSSPLPAKIWAKSARGNRPGESLARHSAAVAAVLSQLALRSPSLATLADDPRLWHRAFWACWLHDLGKAAGAFQRYLRGERTHWEHRHEVLSLAFLPWVTPPETEDFPWIAGAIASHHRDARVIVGERYNPINPPEDLGLEAMVAELEDEAIVGIATWLRETGPAWLADSSLSRLGVGPAEAAPRQVDVDRFRREAPRAIIGALEAYRRLWRAHREIRGDGAARRQGLLLRGLVVLSDHLASAHARRLDPLVIPSAEVLLERAGAHGGQLKSHQVAARDVEGSLVLAAPTGSGKTEAALLWAGRQCKDRPIPSKLIYLLPYQASANAMRRRLRDQLETEVGLLHGRGAQVLYRELAEGGCDGQQAEREARRAVDLARLHHPPVWVATPYQLLRAAYRLPAYETIWTSLGSALIVIDEPHAYEPIRLGLLLGLLGELVQNWDVRVCAMTATMPTWLRALLQEALGAPSLPVDHDLFAQFRRHRLVLVPGEIVDAATIARIADEVRAGRSVLVGVNTVARAQIVRSALLQHLGPERVRLLHSRFCGRDRLAKEEEILDRMRAGGGQPDVPALAVVATQVIEVSLDLDFDTIYTEPAPLEALAQRFGRVNRRGRKVIVPVHVLTMPLHGQGVYERGLVEETLRQLGPEDGHELDEAVLGSYLDSIYAAQGMDVRFAERADRSRREFEASCIRALSAFESDEALEEEFDRLFEGTEVLPAGLAAEYRRLAERSVLEAQTLLVPLQDRQRRRLGRSAVWDKDLKLWIVDVPYDPQLGLLLPVSHPSE